MAKKAREVEAEMNRIIAINRANCDHLLHALIKLGFRDDDVEPLRGYAVKRHICTLTSFFTSHKHISSKHKLESLSRSYHIIHAAATDNAPLFFLCYFFSLLFFIHSFIFFIYFRDIGHAELGKGYVRFMLSAEDLVSCEPKLSSSKVAPIMLEVYHQIF